MQKFDMNVEKRNSILNEISTLENQEFIYSYVNSLYQKEKMKVENLDIKRSESKNANIVKYRDWVITF